MNKCQMIKPLGFPYKSVVKLQFLAFFIASFSSNAWAIRVLNLEHEHVPDQLIVRFKPSVEKSKIASVITQLGGDIRHVFRSSQAMSIAFRTRGDDRLLERQAERLAERAEVLYVEANTIMKTDATIPNDPDFGQLYGLHNLGQTGGSVDADIDIAEAWDFVRGSRDVLVGIIDTGVDYTHPDIRGNYWTNPGETGLDASGNDKTNNGIDDDQNGFVDDFRGWDFANNDNDPIDDHDHGTHCAGTIGGQGDNGIGVSGVNWQVSMVGLKFLSANGSGSLEDAVEAIEYATRIGAAMTSNSWGGGGYSPTMEAAIAEANAKGILFIAAAGNNGNDNDLQPHYPSSYEHDNVVAVAASDDKDRLASFSCFGQTSVDLAAPGVDIFSTTRNGRYESMSGTSMATPHVTGVAALLKAAYPQASSVDIKARLLNTVDPVADFSGKILSGGRVNAHNALENDVISPNIVSDLQIVATGMGHVDLKWSAVGDDGLNGYASRYELRWAETDIQNEADWAAANRSPGSLVRADNASQLSTSLRDIPFETHGFIVVRAIDNVGNVGELSPSVTFSTRPVHKILDHAGDTLDGTSADGPWGLEQSDSGTVISDSPNNQYQNNADSTLVFDPLSVETPELSIAVEAAWDLETNYDFVHVEVSFDQKTWRQLDQLTGSSEGKRVYYLQDELTGAKQISLRLRLDTDHSVVRDGIKIKRVMVYAPSL